MAEPIILTIGHSTRPLQDFVALLAVHRVGRLADIRTVPKSRRHPQFSIERLRDSLPEAGVAYRHFPGLGGLRKAKRDSRNTAWRHEGFRGYADYMETDAFAEALDELITWARAAPDGSRTAIMCAEALWWRCHRRLVADALVARGIEVGHIMSAAGPAPHELTEFARIDGQRVSYPGLL